MQEIWKDVKGYEGMYQVSNLGRIKSLDRTVVCNRGYKLVKGMILKGEISKKGYCRIRLSNGVNNRKKYFVHRIVAFAFICNQDNKPFINHIDGNKLNNNITNLEWCTCSENIQHAFDNGLKKSPKYWKGKFGTLHPNSISVNQLDLNGNIINTFGSISEASRKTGTSLSCIANVCKGIKNRKMANGYIWQYA